MALANDVPLVDRPLGGTTRAPLSVDAGAVEDVETTSFFQARTPLEESRSFSRGQESEMRMKIQVALWLALVFSSQRAPASPLVVTSGQAAQASAAEAELLQALEYGAQVSTPQDTVSINATLSSPSVSANAGNVFKAAILAALRQMSSGATAATTTTATFTQPTSSPVTIAVVSNAWMAVGQPLFIADSSGDFGSYQVQSLSGTTSVSAINLQYASSGTSILSGAAVVASGLAGPTGATGTSSSGRGWRPILITTTRRPPAGGSGARTSGSPRVGAIRAPGRVCLSRWCAVVRWFLDDQELIEFVYDTTDVVRDVQAQNRELLRAVVCLQPRYAASVATLAAALGVPTA